MSQKTWDLIGQRRELHLRLIVTSNENEREDLKQQYQQIRKCIDRSARRDKRVWALPWQSLAIDCSLPTREEVACAIRTLENGKAPGLNLITTEMLKADIETASTALTPLLQRIWQEEELPKDCSSPCQKKGTSANAATGEVSTR